MKRVFKRLKGMEVKKQYVRKPKTARLLSWVGLESLEQRQMLSTVPTLALDAASNSGSLADLITNDTTPTFTGTADANGTVRVYVEGNLAETTTADGNGEWSVTLSNALADGEFDITATSDDGINGESEDSQQLTLTIDATAPATPGALDLDADSDSGDSDTDNVTSDTTPTFDGSAEQGTTITVTSSIDGVIGTFASNDNNFTFTPNTLSEGVHQITFTATDTAGNASNASPAISVTIDASMEQPTIDLAQASDSGASNSDNNTSDRTPTLNGTGEAGAIVEVFDGQDSLGVVDVDQNGDWTFTPDNNLSEGQHSFTARTTDLAGNTSTSAALVVTIDVEPPADPPTGRLDAGSDTGASNSDGITSDDTPTLSGVAEANATVTLVINGGAPVQVTADGDGAWSYTSGQLPQGEYSVVLTQTDLAGNTSDPSDPFVFTIDTAAPGTPSVPDLRNDSDTGEENDDNLTNDSTPTFSGTAEPGATVVLISDVDDVIGSGVADDEGDWTITVSQLQAGAHEITALARDTAGNESGESNALSITVDLTTVQPTIDLQAGSDSGASDSDNITNDTTPSFSGTAEAGASVSVFSGQVPLGTTTADQNGDWSLTSIELGASAHSITAVATDLAGNQSTSNILSLLVDVAANAPTVALAVSSNSGQTNDNLTLDDTPTFTGTAEPGATVSITIDQDAPVDVVADQDGVWSYTAGVLAEGDHTITATQTDLAGNTSAASQALTITIDTTDPAVPSTPDLVAGSDSGVSDTDNLTSDNTPTFTGTGDVGSTIELSADGEVVGLGVVDEQGNWSITANQLPDGDYTITAVAYDAAGNMSAASNGLDVTIDTTAPAAPSTPDLQAASDSGTLDTDNITKFAQVTVQGTATAGATITLLNGQTVLGTTTADQNGDWTVQLAQLEDGSYSVFARITDDAGNHGDSAALSLTIDSVAPAAPTLTLAALSDSGPSNSDGITSDNTPTLGGTAEAGATVVVTSSLDGAIGTATADGEGNWTLTPGGLSQGSHQFTATATDVAGNTSVDSSALVVVIDSTAPSAPGSLALDNASNSGSLADTITNDTTPTITGTAEVGSTVRLFDGDTPLGFAVADENGNWSITATELAAGAHTLTATATDTAGNTSVASAELVVTVDTTAPAAPTITLDDSSNSGSDADLLTNDQTLTLTGTAEAGSTVEVFDGETSLGTAVADESGNWTLTTGALTEGDHSLTAVATDVAGNSSVASAALEVEIDITAPTVTITPVSPSPRSSPVTSFTLVFSEPVTGLTIADLSLKLGDGENLLTDSQTLTTTDNITWTLGNVSALTTTPGAYTLSVLTSGMDIADAAGNILGTGAAANFTVTANNTAPTISKVDKLTGAFTNTPYTISYEALLAASNATDADAGAVLSFVIDGVKAGTLTKNGQPVVAGTTTLSAGETLVYTPPAGKKGNVNAFSVKVSDGTLTSAKAAKVNITVEKPKVSIVAVNATGAEVGELGPVTASFTITRTGPTTEPATIQFKLSGKAKNGIDFIQIPTSITIAAGESTATLVITPIADEILEGAETFKILLQKNDVYDLGSPKSVTGTIVQELA
jgi:hypothetical protein